MSHSRRFTNTGDDFSALWAAEKWCSDNAYTVGAMERNQPIGICKGAEYIAKWTRMSFRERSQLDGEIIADGRGFRRGDVEIILKDNP